MIILCTLLDVSCSNRDHDRVRVTLRHKEHEDSLKSKKKAQKKPLHSLISCVYINIIIQSELSIQPISSMETSLQPSHPGRFIQSVSFRPNKSLFIYFSFILSISFSLPFYFHFSISLGFYFVFQFRFFLLFYLFYSN